MKWKILATGVLALMGLCGGAASQSLSAEDLIQAELLSGWQQPDGSRMAGLRLVLAPGWKTYWRAPGEGGIPPQFAWNGSRNLESVLVHWPRPLVQVSNGMRTIGYRNEVVLPLTVTAKNAGKAVTLKARLDLGVCEEVCVPVQLDVTVQMDGAGASDPRIHQALAAQPITAQQAGVGSVTCTVEPLSDGLRLTTKIGVPKLAATEHVMIESGDPSIWVSEPQVSRTGNTLTAVTELVPPSAQPFALNRSALRYTVVGGTQAVDIIGCTSG